MAIRMALILALGLGVSMTAAHGDEEREFVPIFNGTDLSGWTGDPELWRVEDGAIVGSTHEKDLKKNSFLSHGEVFDNFILRFKVKLTNHNSGVQFRSEQLDDFAVAGYQADVVDEHYFGLLYEERKRGILPYWHALSQEERDEIHNAAKQGEWNEYEVKAHGDHIKLTVNGFVTCDIIDPDGAKEGIIALQLHTGPAMEVRFKDIEVKQLDPPNDTDESIKTGLLEQGFDETREERLAYRGERFRAPEGFTVEEVATNQFVGSIICMTFDPLGRPALAQERKGLVVIEDSTGDGKYDRVQKVTDAVTNIMGIHYLGLGDILVQGQGPDGPGIYRVRDTNGDEYADETKLILLSDGGMGEHGPHAILQGVDAHFYVLYGNHSRPADPVAPDSPVYDSREDNLLPSYVDPRGHANHVQAPGGTVQRLDEAFGNLTQTVGGFRNAYGFAFNEIGELFTFDSDMEWDIGMPWFRPVRVVHAIPGGDYGWRTGSRKWPFYYLDTLPSIDDVGRGSPVGVRFYHHTVYPEKYYDAFFMGDWSRGRIRVIYPQKDGATYVGVTEDFIVGEPLNVTDLDIGPDGFLYFAVGGRGTHGGLFRVRYDAPAASPVVPQNRLAVLEMPQHRSAWAQHLLREGREKMGARWDGQLLDTVRDVNQSPRHRMRALELLQIFGPKPEASLLLELLKDNAMEVRATAALLLGTHPFNEVRDGLGAAVADGDAFVARRAAESLLRAGLGFHTRVSSDEPLLTNLVDALGHEDKFLRYAARTTLTRIYGDIWRDLVLAMDPAEGGHAVVEGLLALIHTQEAAQHADKIAEKVVSLIETPMDGDLLLDYLRLIQLAIIRDVTGEDRRDAFAPVGEALLARFPTEDWRLNREIQVVVAHLETAGAIDALLAYLTPDKSQEEQIFTVYALRAIKEGWTAETRNALVDWFDYGRTVRGGASAEGFINNLWHATLALLPSDEKRAARDRAEAARKQRMQEALALVQELEEERAANPSTELANMSFEELAEYLEYDPMAYRANLEQGERVFIRTKCAACHVFGEVGTGGGPDLSTVTSRFRRRDILEAIMFPSRVISDQYIGVDLELDDFSTVTGMVVTETDTTLSLIQVDGVPIEIDKSMILTQKEAEESIMPEGLINTMSLGDLVALINYLERGAAN